MDYKETIFVVEDNWELNQGICHMLEKEGYQTKSAHSIKEAKAILAGWRADLLLLDVNLPDGEGFALCERVRKTSDIPVLFLTARDIEEDVLKGYEMGAEDYVTKPFSMKILLKKLRVILRRDKDGKTPVWDDGYLKIDVGRARVEIEGTDCPVTPTEIRILQEFISHKGQLLTYEVLLDRLWEGGSQFVDKHALAVNMGRLRSKIEDDAHKYISNVYGMGYQWIG